MQDSALNMCSWSKFALTLLTNFSDLIFSVPKSVSFLSQGTTLPPGTIILTGTPAGVGFSFDPKEYLTDGDEFAVEILPHTGTLATKFEAENEYLAKAFTINPSSNAESYLVP